MTDIIKVIVTEKLLETVIAVISIIVSYYIIPIIKSNLVIWLKDKHIYDTVKKFVQAAEKLAESGTIEKVDKKDYVINLLKEQGIKIDTKVEAFIESAVEEIDLIAKTARDEIMKDEE